MEARWLTELMIIIKDKEALAEEKDAKLCPEKSFVQSSAESRKEDEGPRMRARIFG